MLIVASAQFGSGFGTRHVVECGVLSRRAFTLSHNATAQSVIVRGSFSRWRELASLG